MSAIDNYYAALERLVSNCPEVLVVGKYKINQDSVCLEAGVGKGAIKPSRGEEFRRLANNIRKAASNYKAPESRLQKLESRLRKKKTQIEELEKNYLEALNRELILINKVKELEIRVSQFDGDVIKKIR
ncbi:hypothetical protein P4S60_00145 [Pseudoalteromonas sp. Hal040]|uniref:hypothetical protein n=1 Tax=unclassified Pseudoalteromonas TaxID=194690 RepID=UPI00301D81AE